MEFVPGDAHCFRLAGTGPAKVSRGRSPQIMKEALGGKPRSLERVSPRLVKESDRLPGASLGRPVEDELAPEAPGLKAAREAFFSLCPPSISWGKTWPRLSRGCTIWTNESGADSMTLGGVALIYFVRVEGN